VFGTVVGELWRNTKTELGPFTEPHRRGKGENVICSMHVRSLHSLTSFFYNMSVPALSTVTASITMSITYGAVNQCYEYA